MYGIYFDLTNKDYNYLASIHQELTISPNEYFQGVLLHTCHRVEWYGDGCPPQEIDWVGATTIYGETAVRSRIATIASGATSLIPGDTLVYQQVSKAFEILSIESDLRQLGEHALAIASNARRLFELTPIVDYADLPRVIANLEPTSQAKELIIVGGGMLAREILQRSVQYYRVITLISRTPKRLSATIKPFSLTNVRVLTPESALARGLVNPSRMVIATTSRRSHYRQQIASLASEALITGILDLSALPTLDQRSSVYAHVNDPEILSLLEESNSPIKVRAAKAKGWIEAQQDA